MAGRRGKAITSAAAAAVIALAAQAVMVALAVVLAGAKGAALGLSSADAAPNAGLAAGAAAWAALGVAVGALVRHQVAAVVGGLVWVLVVENLASGFLKDAGRFLPGQAAHAVANATAASELDGGGAVAIAVKEGDGHSYRAEVGQHPVGQDDALERAAIGGPGVDGAVGGDGGGEVAHHQRSHHGGEGSHPAHGDAERAGERIAFHCQAGQDPQAADLSAGRGLVGIRGQAEEE